MIRNWAVYLWKPKWRTGEQNEGNAENRGENARNRKEMQGMQESGNAGNQGCDTENQNGNLDIAVGMT